jgi:hypothetical protein
MSAPKHRIRKGWDCPHCKMHFGWEKQFKAHIEGKHCDPPNTLTTKPNTPKCKD